jgi:hypothetical protein
MRVRVGYALSADRKAITCLKCGATSYHPGDINNRYCARCHVFHEDIERCQEFDCIECGRHIILIAGPAGTDKCGACQVHPGWFRDPAVAALLDPENDRKPRELQ